MIEIIKAWGGEAPVVAPRVGGSFRALCVSLIVVLGGGALLSAIIRNSTSVNAAVTATTITPQSGSASGGTEVTITGTNLQGEVITQVAAGEYHSLALSNTGQVYVWGSDEYGQLGDGTVGPNANPTPTNITANFAGLSGQIVQVAGGRHYSVALSSSGQVYTWGRDQNGQLGDGTVGTPNSNPTPINITANFAGLSGKIIKLSAGFQAVHALTDSGQLWGWGNDGFGTLGDGTPGYDGDNKTNNPTPINVTANFAGLSGQIIDIVGDKGSSTIVLSSSGQVYTFGSDSYGNLGDGTVESPTGNATPINITANFAGLTGQITKIGAGNSTSFAITNSGQLYAWGNDSSGQLGDGTTATPDKVPTPTEVTANFAGLTGQIIEVKGGGSAFTAVLTSSGQVYTFGRDYYGYGFLGNGTTDTSYFPTPTEITANFAGLKGKITGLSAGDAYVLALTETGQVYSWGVDALGQLGDGLTDTPAANPTPINITAFIPATPNNLTISIGDSPCIDLVTGSTYITTNIAPDGTSVKCKTGPNDPSQTPYNVSVTAGGITSQLPSAYTYGTLPTPSLDQTSGLTGGGEVITISGDFSQTPSMQTFSADHCAAMPIYDPADPDPASTIVLFDRRGVPPQQYMIRKMADGKCWMINNLRLPLDFSSLTLSPADTNISDDLLVHPSDLNKNSYTEPLAYGLFSDNPDYDPYMPNSEERDITSPNFAGLYYNWCLATGGQVNSFGTCVGETEPPVDADEDICPLNWRLPRGGDVKDPNNEFDQLNAYMAGYVNGNQDVAYPSNAFANPSFADNWRFDGPFQGVDAAWFTANLSGSGQIQYYQNWGNLYGLYWSSSMIPAEQEKAMFLVYGDDYNWVETGYEIHVSPDADAVFRNDGLSIRCLADSTYAAPTPTVTFDGVVATVISSSDTEITVAVPAHTAGTVDVAVAVGSDTATVAAAYTYTDPPLELTSISPTLGPTAGGTVVTITGRNIIPSVATPTTLQEMSQAYCATMTVYDGTNPAAILTLKDTRNNQDYNIAKLADDKCWFLDNLKLQLTNGLTLTPADTDVVNNTTVWFTQDGTQGGTALPNMTGNFTNSGYMTRNGNGTATAPNFDAWRQVNPTNLTDCANGSSYNSDSQTGCGYIYNFYTATAGTVPQSLSTAGAEAPGSICPANWRLPSGYYDSSDIDNDLPFLNARMNDPTATTGSTDSTYYTNWQPSGAFRGVLLGYRDSSFDGQGQFGAFWSSTVYSASNGYALYFSTVSVYPGDHAYYRRYGFAVRCVTNSESFTPTVTFDNIPATNVSVVDNGDGTQTVTAVTPAHATAVVSVKVDNGTSNATLTNAYTYLDPMIIDSITPNHDIEEGGATVTITGKNIIVPTLATPTTMQGMSTEYCKTMPVYDTANPNAASTLTLTDTRDGQEYMVRKLADGNCWMINNLKLGSTTGTTALSPSNTNISQAWTLPQISIGSASFTEPKVMAYSPQSSDLNDPTFYGYHYNWCAATAGGDGTSGNGTCSSEYVAPVDAVGDICPANWRLPRGGYQFVTTNEFSMLNARMAGFSDNLDPTYQANWTLYPDGWKFNGEFRATMAGYYSTNGLGVSGWTDVGQNTDLWGSNYRGDGHSKFAWTMGFAFSSGSVGPANSVQRNYGLPVRCMSEGGLPGYTVTFDTGAAAVVATDVSVVDNGDGTQTLTATVPAHTPGLVAVTVDNGIYSAVLAAVCNDDLSYGGDTGNSGTACNGQLDSNESQNGDRANVVSGFLYEEIYISITVDRSMVDIGGSSGLNPSPSGIFGTATSVATTITNHPNGYSLSISTDKPSSDPHAKDLKHLLSDDYVTGTANTCTWSGSSLDNTTVPLSVNTWGFTLSTSNRDAEQLCQIPSSSAPLTIRATAQENATGDVTSIHFGAKIDFAIPAGEYQATIIYTVETRD
ncbi:MAG: IPT/TIG domain-containing protein [Candidatus Nomurabacteria bacterium]|nr:IPT/TIG domain-containing protein [Candidatus Nomurabacteria bacterium]